MQLLYWPFRPFLLTHKVIEGHTIDCVIMKITIVWRKKMRTKLKKIYSPQELNPQAPFFRRGVMVSQNIILSNHLFCWYRDVNYRLFPLSKIIFSTEVKRISIRKPVLKYFLLLKKAKMATFCDGSQLRQIDRMV